MGQRRRWASVGVFAITLLACAFAWNCRSEKPIPVGFSAQLTGKQAELGVQERNGAQLAIDQCNRQGGIHGRMLKLLIRDDAGIPERAREADRDLVRQGVVAIIGHSTSAQSIAGLEVTNPARRVMIAPTVSSPLLSGRDDFFFRVYPSFQESATIFARCARKEDGITRFGILFDEDNAGYSRAYLEAFRRSFLAEGGREAELAAFSATAQPVFDPMLARLRSRGVDGLLIIASDTDTALIAQRTRVMKWPVPLYTSAWAQTTTLIQSGGRAVEGLKIEQSFAPDHASPRFREFRTLFESRFGHPPSFGAVFSYEAAQVLIEALKRCQGRAEGLKEAMLETRHFQGLMDPFSLDRFGDVDRPFYLSEVQGGRFIVLKKLTSPQSDSR
ncbi:ABC transporter substrate-binding protein [Holophaga foetida]|uniref:ABC transporter substrate-binding protein n=1 Tax=Holophaga foetida TaxID=35839 RepID=UPI0002473710|nr:ABC transporter substrate-binding protein [Holophaga foetida]